MAPCNRGSKDRETDKHYNLGARGAAQVVLELPGRSAGGPGCHAGDSVRSSLGVLALWLLEMARQRYASPGAVALPKAHLAGLEGVEWPDVLPSREEV